MKEEDEEKEEDASGSRGDDPPGPLHREKSLKGGLARAASQGG
ncbi:hypothetical protein DVDV_1427 [Desulfovibrio sp. DV]|nr:hypothetical protein DVDV_1427 [Desulfovibrio sp. DV]